MIPISSLHLHVVLFSLSAISFFGLIYPYIVYPWLLRFLPKCPYSVSPNDGSKGLKMALLFCAYNEERSIPIKLDNIRAIKERFPDIEVHAYADCCSDGTVVALRKAPELVTVHEGNTRVGKASGMSKLVAATSADILVFSDANVVIDPDCIPRISSYFKRSDIGTVAGTLHYTNSEDSETARVSGSYWKLEELIKRRESETGSTMGADGSIFAMRRCLYPEVPEDLLDDMISSITPIFLDYRVVSVPDVHAFERAATKSSDEFRRKRRIACRAFNTHRYLLPKIREMSLLNRFKYYSHKYIRWFSAGFLLLALSFLVSGIAVWVGTPSALAALLMGLTLLAVGHKFNLPIVGTIAEITLSIVAVGFGVAEAISGRTYQIWSPAKSRE